MLLTKRSMPFFCPDCLSNVKQLLNLVDRVGLIESQLAGVRNEVVHLTEIATTLESKISKIEQVAISSSSPVDQMPSALDQETMWQEMQERQRRANNVMLFNVPEKGTDGEDIPSILNTLCDNPPTIIQYNRVGKKNVRGARALKITLTSQNDALSLIRNRNKLRGSNIYINLDLTSRQQQLEKQTRTEYMNRKSHGEDDIQFRYVGGVPRIVRNSVN